MEVKAQACYVRVTSQKTHRVVNKIRGKATLGTVDTLRFTPQAVVVDVRKMPLSVIASAKVRAEQVDETFNEVGLEILEACVDEGPIMKRFHPRAQGRAGRILKRTSHITIVIGTKEDRRKGGR